MPGETLDCLAILFALMSATTDELVSLRLEDFELLFLSRLVRGLAV